MVKHRHLKNRKSAIDNNQIVLSVRNQTRKVGTCAASSPAPIRAKRRRRLKIN